jgi:predicted SAM-dependent methyltransferase
VDLVPADREVIAFDLRRKLSFLGDETMDLIYHEHFFEHLHRRKGRQLLEECLRVLKKGGCASRCPISTGSCSSIWTAPVSAIEISDYP